MFDFGQIVDKLSNLFGQNITDPQQIGNQLSELAQSVNLDPSILENASLDQLSTMLSEAGIDPTNLSEADLLGTAQELLQSGVASELGLDQLLGDLPSGTPGDK